MTPHSERYLVVLETPDPALSVVLLRRLLKHLGRSYGLKAVSVTRQRKSSAPKPFPAARTEQVDQDSRCNLECYPEADKCLEH